MTTAAVYARVSSKRQAKDHTIGSQVAALRAHAAHVAGSLGVPEVWCDVAEVRHVASFATHLHQCCSCY